jgi:hypothetical protein
MAFNITRRTIALLVLLSILPSVFGLYFYLEDTEQKCFIEELPEGTMVIGKSILWILQKKAAAVAVTGESCQPLTFFFFRANC